MSKPVVLERLDPQKMTKAITDALPKMEVLLKAKEREERLSKAIRTWWRGLPNDGVRMAIPLSATLLVAGVITGLVVGYAHRH